jgi:hypothetical protein
MKMENNSIENLFASLENEWDIHEPSRGHAQRFLDKQHRKRGNMPKWLPLSIAASILVAIGLLTFRNDKIRTPELASLSKSSRETDSVFTAAIKYELEKVKEKNSPLNKQIVKDAMVQLELMNSDYEKIRLELAKNGESEQLIHALISNLKIQISFLENVLQRIQNNEQLKANTNENHI